MKDKRNNIVFLISSKIFNLLSEDNHNTWLLHGAWRVETAHNLIPISWHPRTCYLDAKWLQSETISLLVKKCRIDQEAIPKIPPTDDNLSKWQEAFKDYPN